MIGRKKPLVDPESETCVPIHFAAKDSAAGRNQIRRNQLFPTQDKPTIRQWAESFGERGDAIDFSRLRYVRTVVCPDYGTAERILGAGMNADEAEAYIESVMVAR